MGAFLAVLCAVLYSSNYILIQFGMRKSKKDNGDFVSLAAAVATLLLIYLALLLFTGQKIGEINGWGVFYFSLAGFFTAFMGRTLLFAGIRHIGSSRAAAIKNSAPVFTVFAAVIFLQERISLWGGIGMAVISAALIWQARHDFVRTRHLATGQNSLGLLVSFLSAIAFGVGQVFRKQGIIHYSDPILGALIGSTFALFAFVLFKLFRGNLKESIVSNVKNINIHFILGGAFTAFAQICFFSSLMFTNVAYTSVIAAMEPIITVILAKLFLEKEEMINLRIGLTACAVFLGTFIIIMGI